MRATAHRRLLLQESLCRFHIRHQGVDPMAAKGGSHGLVFRSSTSDGKSSARGGKLRQGHADHEGVKFALDRSSLRIDESQVDLSENSFRVVQRAYLKRSSDLVIATKKNLKR